MLHSAIEIIAWVRIYSLGPIYLRQHPTIRKRTKTTSQVCNEQLSMGFCSSVTPAWKHLGVLSTNGCGRLSYIRILSGKKKCLYDEVLAYWTSNRTMWSLAMGDVVCSSSGGFATRSFIIMYIITAVHVVSLGRPDRLLRFDKYICHNRDIFLASFIENHFPHYWTAPWKMLITIQISSESKLIFLHKYYIDQRIDRFTAVCFYGS
jgi:hypothetical protein